MEIEEIEQKISCHELNAPQVFTQMRQHIASKNSTITEALSILIELDDENTYRIFEKSPELADRIETFIRSN